MFNTSIFENIRYGCAGSAALLEGEDARRRVQEAAVKAYAQDFIMGLPQGYETIVGEKGAQLSGGQRQRVATARALMKDPKILLLDEATSALDVKSESVVQKALEAAAEQRTTIVVAHRLSIVRDAHKIIVLSDGGVIEQGTHDELLSKDGLYASMVRKQQIGDSEKNSEAAPDSNENQKDPEKEDLVKASKAEERTPNHVTVKDKETEVIANHQVEQGVPLSIMQTLRFIARMNRPESAYLLVGLLSAIFAGFAVPA